MIPRLTGWWQRRQHRRELEERAEEAEAAERTARDLWPQIRRAADGFTADMQRAIRPRPGSGSS